MNIAANSVAVIDPGSRRLLKAVAVGTRPGALAEADGSVWVANLDDGTITGIDTRSLKTLPVITPGGPISDMTSAGDSLWVSEATLGVARVDATVGAVTKHIPVSVYHPGALVQRRCAPAGRGRRVLVVGRPVRCGNAL